VGRELIPGTDPASPPDPGVAGFSLIELLVVIAILSVLTVGAVLATGRGGTDTPDMARFQTLFTQTQALAVAGRQARGLKLDPDGLRLAYVTPEGWAISDVVQPWQGRVSFQAAGGFFDPQGPDIIQLPNGRGTAFTIAFTTGVRCQSDGWTGLTCDAR
jgi:prepilin-type N-terminal cleavage/methylation domain-containing protein